MGCERVPMPAGGFAIVCGTRAARSQRAQDRCACGKRATLLCDWKLPASGSEAGGKKPRTCDAPICTSCATSPAPDKDICPAHAPALRAWQRERTLT